MSVDAESTTSNNIMRGYAQNTLRFSGDPKHWLIFSERFKCILGVYNLDNVLVTNHADANDEAKKKKVYQLLVSAINDETFKIIYADAKNDGKKALEILSERYLGSKSDLEVELLTDLFDVQIQCNENHTKFISRIDLIKSQLESNNVKLPDKAFTVLALRGLTDSKYDQFCSSVKVRKEWPLWTEFKSLIKVHESPMFSADSLPENEVVLTTKYNKYKGNASGFKSKTKSHLECTFCKKRGHTEKQCFKRKAKLKQENDSVKTVSSDSNETDPTFNFKCEVVCDSNKCEVVCGSTIKKTKETSDSLLVDSGATSHIICNKEKFISFDQDYNPADHYVELADGTRTNGLIKGRGVATFKVPDRNNIIRTISVNNALYIPSYSLNIFSVKKATDQGASFVFSTNEGTLTASNGIVFAMRCINNLYYLNTVECKGVHTATLLAKCPERILSNVEECPKMNLSNIENSAECPERILSNVEDSITECYNFEENNNHVNSIKSGTHSVEIWHKIMGHCNIKDIFHLQKVVNGMHFSDKNVSDCDTCFQGKMFENMSKKPDKKANTPFEFVHTDLNGPINLSKEGYKYVITFVDDYSGNIAIYFLKQKSDTVAATKRFLADMAPWGTIKRLRSDNGTEYTSASFRSLMIDKNIRQEFSAPYSPHQNGTAERSWRTLFDMARCLLLAAKLPKSWWPHAVQTSAYIRNRCYNPRLDMTAYEAITGKKPNLNTMHIFGTICFAYVQDKSKLDPRSEEGVFLGYDMYSPAYIIYLPKRNIIKKIRSVKFTDKFKCTEYDTKPVSTNGQSTSSTTGLTLPSVPIVSLQDPPDTSSSIHDNENDTVSVRRNPPRQRLKPKRFQHTIANVTVDYCYRLTDIPRNFKEAISSEEAVQWKEAMSKEIQSLRDNDTYDLVPLPDDQSVIGGRWVFANKLGPDGEEHHKARYVAKGYSQVHEVDYLETFAPTPRRTTFRIMMHKAVQEKMIVHHMDFDTAYLNADLDCDVYVKQPDGFVEKPNMVWKLKKSLYGLKQSGRMWNTHLNKFLTSEGFVRSMTDPCLYTYFDGMNTVNIIVWVDDLLIAASNQEILIKVKGILSQNFKMKDLGTPSYFLGIQFSFNKDSIVMQQSKYVDKLLQRFNMTDCKIKPTPCPLGINKDLGNHSNLLEDNTLYREIVGSLIYLMTNTRPDLSYVVTLLGQFMSKPTIAHLNLAKHVLRYLKGTKSLGLNFVKTDSNLEVFGYCDSDWGGSSDRRSISGYCFMLHQNGPLVSWKSCKQNIVALSSCEAEYIALTSAFKEARFLRQLFADINGCQIQSVKLFGDNQGAIALAKNPVHHQRSKHIDIRFHFIRFDVEEGIVNLEYVPSIKNYADLFTKPLSRIKFNDFALIRGPQV